MQSPTPILDAFLAGKDHPTPRAPAMPRTYRFHVEIHEGAERVGRQTTADVVRNDGKVIRCGMFVDYAEADCALLNECATKGLDSVQYRAMRFARVASCA